MMAEACAWTARPPGFSFQPRQRRQRFEKHPFARDQVTGIGTAPTGDKAARFKDPEGNVLAVSQHP